MKRILLILGFLSICVLIACNNDNSTGIITVPPTISSFEPTQVSRGEKGITGHIQGSNFNSVTSVVLGGGITVEKFTTLNPAEIEVIFSVDAGAIPGSRTVSVNTVAGTATASLLSVIDNRAPTARFTVTPSSGAKNTNFILDGTASSDSDGELVRFKWDFGDGEKSNGPVVTHTFASAGTFNVTLSVEDNENATAETAKDIEVENQSGPVPNFTVTPGKGDVATVFHFDASSSSGHITDYIWIFGDGTTAHGVTVDHQFKKSGRHDVELIVTDNNGFQSALLKKLNVGEFDEAKAIAEIQALLNRFFFRYSQLETQPAEWIVEGWSPNCAGRQHEIDVINQQKPELKSTTATVIPPIVVEILTFTKADAQVTARFDFVTNDDVPHSGVCTHDFTMIVENGEWQVCDFAVSCQ